MRPQRHERGGGVRRGPSAMSDEEEFDALLGERRRGGVRRESSAIKLLSAPQGSKKACLQGDGV